MYIPTPLSCLKASEVSRYKPVAFQAYAGHCLFGSIVFSAFFLSVTILTITGHILIHLHGLSQQQGHAKCSNPVPLVTILWWLNGSSTSTTTSSTITWPAHFTHNDNFCDSSVSEQVRFPFLMWSIYTALLWFALMSNQLYIDYSQSLVNCWGVL